MKSFFLFTGVIFLCALVWYGFKTSLKPAVSALSNSSQHGNDIKTPASNINTLKESVVAESKSYKLSMTGTVMPDAQSTLTVRMPSRIAKVLVQLGDTVRPRQILVQFDDTEILNQIRIYSAVMEAARIQLNKAYLGKAAQKLKLQVDQSSARASLLQTKQKLKQSLLSADAASEDAKSEIALAEDTVSKAQNVHTQAQVTLKNLEKLAQAGGVSMADLEGAKLQESTSNSDLKSARTQLKRLQASPDKTNAISYRTALAQKDVEIARQGVAQSDIAVGTADKAFLQGVNLSVQDIRSAAAQLDQARASYQGAVAQHNFYQLVSPLHGIVSSISARVGETAQPGSPLLSVVSADGLHVEALVSARHLSHMRIHLPVQVRVDTMPGKLYNAHTSFISHTAESDGRSFRVRFEFDKRVIIQPGVAATITLR